MKPSPLNSGQRQGQRDLTLAGNPELPCLALACREPETMETEAEDREAMLIVNSFIPSTGKSALYFKCSRTKHGRVFKPENDVAKCLL